MTTNRSCPICGKGLLQRHKEVAFFTYKNESKSVNDHFSVCDSCGVEQADTGEMKLNKRSVIKAKKEVEGLLTGEEVLQMRKTLGVNQEDASKIFGGGPVAFSKYEKDDVMQSVAMDNIFRLAMDVPGAFEYLCKRSGVSVRKINVIWTARVSESGYVSFGSNDNSSNESAWEITHYENNLVLESH